MNDEVHDHRPLSTAAEALSTGKRAVMSWKRRNPKRFAAAATATVVGVLTPGIAALIVGVSGDSDPTEPDENTTGIDDLLVGAWENALRPTIADPLAAWAETHLVAGTDLPGYAPVILWAVLGGLVWLLGLGRSINAKVVWPAFGGATTLAAYAGAAPDREAVTVGACVLLWLLLSLPVYRRRTPRPKPEPRPSWEERRRTEKLRDAEHYKRILDMATPGSEEHGILRHYLDAEVRYLTQDAQRQRAQDWVEIFSAGKRFTASMAMVGAGAYLLLAVPLLGAGVTALGIVVSVFSLPLLAMGLVEHSDNEREAVRVGHSPTDRARQARSDSNNDVDTTGKPAGSPVDAL